jgi:hypothetical protein
VQVAIPALVLVLALVLARAIKCARQVPQADQSGLVVLISRVLAFRSPLGWLVVNVDTYWLLGNYTYNIGSYKVSVKRANEENS